MHSQPKIREKNFLNISKSWFFGGQFFSNLSEKYQLQQQYWSFLLFYKISRNSFREFLRINKKFRKKHPFTKIIFPWTWSFDCIPEEEDGEDEVGEERREVDHLPGASDTLTNITIKEQRRPLNLNLKKKCIILNNFTILHWYFQMYREH